MITILLLMLSGAAGAVCRYLLGVVLSSRVSGSFIPLPMLLVNTAGSFGLGVFLGVYFESVLLLDYGDRMFVILGTGFFGAFTTFSSFAVEASSFIRNGKWMPFLWYTSLSIIGSVIAFMFGFLLFT